MFFPQVKKLYSKDKPSPPPLPPPPRETPHEEAKTESEPEIGLVSAPEAHSHPLLEPLSEPEPPPEVLIDPVKPIVPDVSKKKAMLMRKLKAAGHVAKTAQRVSTLTKNKISSDPKMNLSNRLGRLETELDVCATSESGLHQCSFFE